MHLECFTQGLAQSKGSISVNCDNYHTVISIGYLLKVEFLGLKICSLLKPVLTILKGCRNLHSVKNIFNRIEGRNS